MSESLDGTVALVTGASSGIGEATALVLAEAGAAVALAARRKDRLDELVRRIEDKGGRAVAFETDVTDRAQAEAVVDQTVGELGRLDTVINNAGVMLLGRIEDAPIDEWERMVDLNVKGVLYITHAALPHLLSAAENPPRRVADLVNISSVAGRVARLGSGVYNLTKWGVNAFSESLRQEGVNYNVRVTIIEPGFVDTELQGHNEHPLVVEEIEKSIKQIGKVLDAEDIANAIVWAVGQPEHVGINEVLVRPAKQRG